MAKLTLNGGGRRYLFGGRGNDLRIGGSGPAWAAGGIDNIVARDPAALETVTLTTSGSGAAIDENIDISANGARATFFRDAANIAMDLNEVERIEFVAGAGADSVTISDLTSVDIGKIDLDRAAMAGGSIGDGAIDLVANDRHRTWVMSS